MHQSRRKQKASSVNYVIDLTVIISKGSDNIGKTLLVEMDIDTGTSPPIASRPYTLPLKHYEWVHKEISTLE